MNLHVHRGVMIAKRPNDLISKAMFANKIKF